MHLTSMYFALFDGYSAGLPCFLCVIYIYITLVCIQVCLGLTTMSIEGLSGLRKAT